MSRVNVGIDPTVLSNRHLIAEHREIKRIPNHVRKFRQKILTTGRCEIPREFKLGPGHVKFFFNKGKYTLQRYEALFQECRRRGFDVTYYGGAWQVYTDLPKSYFQDYDVTIEARELIKQRLIEKDISYLGKL